MGECGDVSMSVCVDAEMREDGRQKSEDRRQRTEDRRKK